MEMAKILIAEDERPIRELIRRNLLLVGHSCCEAEDGPQALALAEAGRFDLALLDVMLPGLDGFEVKRLLPPDLPVIFVTARTGLSSRLQGLGLGADDYILKPFEILELLARVEAVLRRTGAGDPTVEAGGCRVDLAQRRVTRDGVEIPLKPQEYALLEVLVRNRNLALSRENCWSWLGAMITRGIPAPWMYMCSGCAKNWGWKKSCRPFTSWATV